MKFIRSFIIVLFCFCSKQIIAQGALSLYDLSNNVTSTGNKVFEIEDGTYQNINIHIANKQNITIKAKRPGKVIITGNVSFVFDNCNNVLFSGFLFKSTKSKELISINGSSNLTIENNMFSKCGGGRYACLIGLNNSSNNNIIKNNTFDANMTIGIAIKDHDNMRNIISYNLFKNVPSVKELFKGSDGNGMESIQIGRGKSWSSYTSVHDNVFDNIIGDGVEIISVKSSQSSIFRNTFKNSRGGVTLRTGNKSSIYSNVFLNTSHPLRIYGSDHQIYDNFIENASVGIQLPSANADKIDSGAGTTYFRSQNIDIKRNEVTKTKTPVLYGNGYKTGRDKLPRNINMADNVFDKAEWVFGDTGKVLQNFRNKTSTKKLKSTISISQMVGVSW